MPFERGKTEAEIKAEIDKILGNRRIDVWTVGTTGNQDLRREKHGRPTIWHYWQPESEAVAKAIEAHYKGKGMKAYAGEVVEGDTSKFLYVTWS